MEITATSFSIMSIFVSNQCFQWKKNVILQKLIAQLEKVLIIDVEMIKISSISFQKRILTPK